jgi:hypothetical protein
VPLPAAVADDSEYDPLEGSLQLTGVKTEAGAGHGVGASSRLLTRAPSAGPQHSLSASPDGHAHAAAAGLDAVAAVAAAELHASSSSGSHAEGNGAGRAPADPRGAVAPAPGVGMMAGAVGMKRASQGPAGLSEGEEAAAVGAGGGIPGGHPILGGLAGNFTSRLAAAAARLAYRDRLEAEAGAGGGGDDGWGR